ncbi:MULTISPECIES: hypothetical protein [Streptomyces]|uniref:hypothetical protein n=1 Tax=Streptomyces TaxID=1883 RepID=UPI001C2EECC0|nr:MULTISPECIES: hypothetical protein [Streptomyces]MBV1945146.1 hypothetical protein [Streptomyces sp. BV129]
MMGRIVRWGAGLGLGAVWWWAVLRLALGDGAGVLEGSVVLGGWGLGVLPVHCVAKERAEGAVRTGRWREAWRITGKDGGTGAGGAGVPRSGEAGAG